MYLLEKTKFYTLPTVVYILTLSHASRKHKRNESCLEKIPKGNGYTSKGHKLALKNISLLFQLRLERGSLFFPFKEAHIQHGIPILEKSKIIPI